MKKIIPLIILVLLSTQAIASEKTEISISEKCKEIDVYMSPDDSQCLAALEQIKKICEENKASLSVKPIMCAHIEKNGSSNDSIIREISPENYPVIILKDTSRQTSMKFEGWTPQVQENFVYTMKGSPENQPLLIKSEK